MYSVSHLLQKNIISKGRSRQHIDAGPRKGSYDRSPSPSAQSSHSTQAQHAPSAANATTTSHAPHRTLTFFNQSRKSHNTTSSTATGSTASGSVHHASRSKNKKKVKPLSPHHEEMVRFVRSSWDELMKEYEEEQQTSDGQKSVTYLKPLPSKHLENFVPVDLDLLWGKAFLEKLNLDSSSLKSTCE